MSGTADIRLFGYFNDTSDTPAYDPGLDAICIYCREKLELPVRSYSLLVPGHDKCFFYRVHRHCGEAMKAEGSCGHYDGLIIDTIPVSESADADFKNWLAEHNASPINTENGK